jgi:hypothetical protein
MVLAVCERAPERTCLDLVHIHYAGANHRLAAAAFPAVAYLWVVRTRSAR